MALGVLLALIAAALFFVYVEQPLLAGLCIIAAGILSVVNVGRKTAGAGRTTAKVLAYGVREDVSKAEPTTPDEGVAVEAAQNAGDVLGQQLHAPDKYKFKYKGAGASVGAAERLIEYFKRVFK